MWSLNYSELIIFMPEESDREILELQLTKKAGRKRLLGCCRGKNE